MLSGSQKRTIIEITGVTLAQLDGRISSLQAAGVYTSDLETEVVDEIDKWDAVKDKFTVITANAEDFGANINPEDRRQAIKTRIVRWLGLEDYIQTSSSTIRLHRV